MNIYPTAIQLSPDFRTSLLLGQPFKEVDLLSSNFLNICHYLQMSTYSTHLSLPSVLLCSSCFLPAEEFIQAVQSTAGMAVVLLIRSVMGSGDQIASVVSRGLKVYF